MKLKTRPSDGAALCAKDPPTLNVGMHARMPEAQAVVSLRCGMTCTSDGGCRHFNYVSTTVFRIVENFCCMTCHEAFSYGSNTSLIYHLQRAHLIHALLFFKTKINHSLIVNF